MKNLNRSALYNSSLSKTFRVEDPSIPWTSPFWQRSPCGFEITSEVFSDDMKVGSVAAPGSVMLNLVDNITGTFRDGWNEAGFLSLQPGNIINQLMSQEGLDLVVTIRLNSAMDDSSSHGAIIIGGQDGKLCESDTTFVGAFSNLNVPSLFIDSVRMGNAVIVGTSALLGPEYSISRIDQASLDVIANLTDAVYNSSTGLYHVDCSKRAIMPNMFFMMGSFEYYLSAEFYTHH
ncbi:hypothetical protein AAVH_29161, partial [Aphelenchoides avenae]